MNSPADIVKPRPIVGVLLAAGRSARMGRPKQTLPWPGPIDAEASTLVAASFDSIAPACARIFVTLGFASDQVRAALGSRAYDPLPCDPDAPMFVSIHAALRQVFVTEPGAPVLLLPADQPGIRPATILTLIDESRRRPDRAITPEYRGRGGHPALIPPAIIAAILQDSGAGGLRGFWERFPNLRVRTPVDDPACARDLDTPDEYETALREAGISGV